MTKSLFVTGATGQVGQYLIRDLLLEGQPLAVLIRSKGKLSATERLEQILLHWEREFGKSLPRPKCLNGDITVPGLGLSPSDRDWVSHHCDGMLHNAASLTFVGSDRSKEPWLTNLTGTGHVVDLCRDLKIRRMQYVSTAFVSGTRTDLIRETELDVGQSFRNDYEHCKFEAERLIRAVDCFDEVTVYRPAVIVGDSITGYTATYHGLYPYLQFAHLISQYAPRDDSGRWVIDVRLNLTGDEHRNLVPIDWVSSVLTYLVLHPECQGKTYHLTPIKPVSSRELEEAMSVHFGYHGPTFVGPDGLSDETMTEMEHQFYQSVTTYAPYWKTEPLFDSTNTQTACPHLPCPTIDVPFLRRLMEFAISDRWGRGPVKKSKPVLAAPDSAAAAWRKTSVPT